jgi:type II secretory pathway pseudopilin PulG
MVRTIQMAERPRLKTARVDAGEVFIESLVAAAIVAMIMVATFRVVTDGASHARMTEQRRVALLVAKSELAEVGSEIPIASGENSGVSGDMIWTVDVSPYSDESGASSVGSLWAVDVSVRPRVGRGELVRLRTLRLAPDA